MSVPQQHSMHSRSGNGSFPISYSLPQQSQQDLFEIEEEEEEDDTQAAALADVVIGHHVRLKEKELNLRREAQLRAQKHAEKTPLVGVEGWEPDPKKYQGRAFGILKTDNVLRYYCIYVVEHGLDQAALLLIIANTALLALFDPLDTEQYRPESSRRDALDLGNQVCSLLFGAEAAIKIVAQGLCFGPNSYLADGWGWLDFVVVLLGLVQDFARLEWMKSISALRAVRILRPLRAVNKIPQLRLLVIFVARVIPTLNTVLLLVAFVFFVFGVVGAQFFNGIFRQRCYSVTTGLISPASSVCSPFEAEGAVLCPNGYQCLPIGEPPYGGLVTFDDVGLSLMTVMQVNTLEGWSEIMDTAQGATASYTGLFFILLVIVGPMFALKTFLAVIAHRLKDTQADTKRLSAAEIIRVLVRRDLLSFLELWKEGILIDRVERLEEWKEFRARQIHRYFQEWEKMRASRRMAERHRTAGVGISVLKKRGQPAVVFNLKEGGNAMRCGRIHKGDRILAVNAESVLDKDEKGVYDMMLGPRGTRVTLTISAPPERRHIAAQQDSEKKLPPTTTISEKAGRSVTLLDAKTKAKNGVLGGSGTEEAAADKRKTRRGSLGGGEEGEWGEVGGEETTVTVALMREVLPTVLNEEQKQKEILTQRKEEQEFEDKAVEIMSVFSGRKEDRVPLRERLYMIATSERLADSIAIVIVFNTICLGMYHELDSQVGVQWTRNDAEREYYYFLLCLEAANLLFLFIFFLEFFIKFIGLGPISYFYQASNVFDFLIVAAGAYEFPEVLSLAICYGSRDDPSTCQDSGTALTVLRCFRLARLVKFFRRFPSFTRQINRLTQMVKPVSTLGFLMILFLTVYCILGMNLFGGRMYEEATWKNVGYGELVYIRVPDDVLPPSLPGRPGIVQEIDIETHPSRPYRVELVTSFTIFGESGDNVGMWCGLAATGPFLAGPGVPAIASRLPRANFDSFSASILTVFQVLTQTDWQFIMYNVAINNGPWSSIYFYSLLFFGNYVLLNIFIGIVVVGFGDSQGQLQIIHRENRDLAARRMEGQMMLKEAVLRAVSVELCNFPGPRCEVESVSVWNMLPFRVDTVRVLEKDTGRPYAKSEINYDYVQIKAPVRRIAETLLGMLDVTTIATERTPTVKDIQNIIMELQHTRIATRKRWHGQENELIEADMDDERSRKKAKATSELFRVIPCLVEHTKSRYEQYTYIAVEYFYRFWDGVENRKMKDIADAVRRKPLTMPQMEATMKVISQARLNAGEVNKDEISTMQLTFHDGSSRCQGMIGAKTQCPNPLSCGDHRGINQRFLHSFQVLKGNLETYQKAGPDKQAKEVKLSHLEFARQGRQEDRVSGLGIPYHVCWYLSWSNPLRYYAGKVVRSTWFETFILVSISLSCVALMIERPERPLEEDQVMGWINFSLTFVFLLEALLKVTWFGPKMYICDPWNQVDLFIVVTGLIELVLDWLLDSLNASALVSFRVLRILRVLRALRPLRVVAQSSSLRAITSSLIGAVGPILQTIALSLIVFSVFAILGMQVLSGAMGYCTDPMIFQREKCTGTAVDLTKRIWLQRTVNFNWIGDAVSAVYIVSSQDHWTERMNEGIDATSEDTGPYRDNNAWLSAFYIFTIFIGGFFVISIFVGVFVQTFFTASTALDAMKPPPMKPTRVQLPTVFDDPKGFFSRRVYNIVTHPRFEAGIMLCIFANVACLSLESYQIGSTPDLVQEMVNNVCSFVFGAEALFKLFGFKPRYYFNDPYNTFDFFLVVTSFAGVALQAQAVSSTTINPSLLRVVRAFRLFRVLRAFRILRSARGLVVIAQVLYQSIAVMFNLTFLLVLIYYVFGVMGVGLFAHMCQQGEERIEGPNGMASRCAMVEADNLISLNANFKNLGIGLFTLFRVSTLDLWSETMLAFGLSRAEIAVTALGNYGRTSVPSERQEYLNEARGALPACQSIEELEHLREAGVLYCETEPCQETCGTIFSLIYFPVFVTLSSFVLMNLVTAVLLRELVRDKDDNKAMVTEYISLPRFHLFCRMWRRNCTRKLEINSRYQDWLQDLVRRHLMGLDEFEAQLDDLFAALRGAPDPARLDAVDEACRIAEARSRPVAASLHAQQEKIESVEEKARKMREAEEKRRREACVSVELIAENPYLDPKVHGIRHQIKTQRLIRQDLASVLQCPPAQIEVVGLYPGPSGRGNKLKTKVVVVILPVKGPGAPAGTNLNSARDSLQPNSVQARTSLAAAEDDEIGAFRAGKNPHALLSELVFKLAQRPGGSGSGAGLELMASQCTISWVKVLAQDATVAEEEPPTAPTQRRRISEVFRTGRRASKPVAVSGPVTVANGKKMQLKKPPGSAAEETDSDEASRTDLDSQSTTRQLERTKGAGPLTRSASHGVEQKGPVLRRQRAETETSVTDSEDVTSEFTSTAGLSSSVVTGSPKPGSFKLTRPGVESGSSVPVSDQQSQATALTSAGSTSSEASYSAPARSRRAGSGYTDMGHAARSRSRHEPGRRYFEAEGGGLSLGKKSIHGRAALYLDMVLKANRVPMSGGDDDSSSRVSHGSSVGQGNRERGGGRWREEGGREEGEGRAESIGTLSDGGSAHTWTRSGRGGGTVSWPEGGVTQSQGSSDPDMGHHERAERREGGGAGRGGGHVADGDGGHVTDRDEWSSEGSLTSTGRPGPGFTDSEYDSEGVGLARAASAVMPVTARAGAQNLNPLAAARSGSEELEEEEGEPPVVAFSDPREWERRLAGRG